MISHIVRTYLNVQGNYTRRPHSRFGNWEIIQYK